MELRPANMAQPSLWMDALNKHLQGIQLTNTMIEKTSRFMPELTTAYRVDRAMMQSATTFAWSKDVVQAIRQVAASIPMDAQINAWNFDTNAAWWWLEETLPIITQDAGDPLVALNMGWMQEFRANKPGNTHFMVVAWVADRNKPGNIFPTQMFSWQPGATLETMLTYIRKEHEQTYGKGGNYRNTPHVNVDVFCKAALEIGQFILAGLAWMEQRIAVESQPHVERHRRKEFERTTKRDCDVRLIELRRTAAADPNDTTEQARRDIKWSVRWTVDGHWRHQACGTGHKERKLIYINPFIKGPAEAPLKLKNAKVYVVRR